MGLKIDLTNKKYGRLFVLKEKGKKFGRPAWLCLCDCGNIIIVAGQNLRNGNTQSCGCLNKDIVSLKLKGKPRPKYVKEKISKTKTGKKRSKFSKEWRMNLSKARIGNKNRYDSTLTNEDRIKRRHLDGYYEWVKSVFNRDNYTCKYCGKYGLKLNAHHLNSYNNHPEQRLDISNGVTLCVECHSIFHKIYGYKCKKYQFDVFVKSFNKLTF